jgi:hypothetical protein
MDKAPPTVTFTSPRAGHVVDKTVVEGSAVKAGDRIMRIADRSTMWLQVQVHEQQLSLVHFGTSVRAQINGIPGKTFEGEIEFIYPHLDMMARTATMRVVLPNEGHALHEGMFATVDIDAPIADNAIQVPREAVIDSGTRQIVFIAQEGGHFEPRKVTVGETGRSSGGNDDDRVQILTGLSGNENVVISGQFLLDSESRMKEAIQKHLRDRRAIRAVAEPAAAPDATAPASTQSSSAGQTDGLFNAYLALQKSLVGAGQTVDASGLAKAAASISQTLPAGDLRDLVRDIGGQAEELAGLPLDKQREMFKGLSAAMISLADKSSPSPTVAPMLEQYHCPMAQAEWLQLTGETANPYLSDMPTCGTLTRKIPAAQEKRP